MKNKNEEPHPLPELEELLQKPNSLMLLGDQKKQGIITPSQASREKSKTPPTEEEETDLVSAVIGKYGRWQLLITFLLAMFSFPCTIYIYLPTFTSRDIKYWCQPPENLSDLPVQEWINYSQPVDACNVRVIPPGVAVESILNHTAPVLDIFQKCTKWEFDATDIGSTIITEWELVCDKASLNSLAEVVFLIGTGVGGVVGGLISDKFGRKRVLMSMLVIQCTLGILTLLVRSYVQYIIVRLLMGLASVSMVYSAFVLSVELVGGKWVTIAGVSNFFPLPVAYIIVSLLSLALPYWRDLQLSVSLPGCLLLLLWFILPESPRWLLSMGRTQEAKEILQKAAKFNNRELPPDLDKMMMSCMDERKHEKANVKMLFKAPLLKRTLCLAVVWFSVTIAYYGLVLNIGNMKIGNLHATSIILAFVEIPAIAITIPILLKCGRRFPIFTTMMMCGTACLASELFAMSYNNDWVLIACLMIGKFSISCSNMMLPIFTAELYPTLLRNLGVGGTQVSSGLALICIPYLWSLETLSQYLPMLTITVLSVVGGVTILALPETGRGRKQKTNDNEKSNNDVVNGTFTTTDDRGQ